MPEALQERPAKPQAFLLIQVLRGLAAIMVVLHHCSILASERLAAGPYRWDAGAAGVDLFFVISGFVMALSVSRMSLGPAAASIFIKRRLERIVPLYWLATTAKVVFILLAPALALHGLVSTWHVLASFLFLPSMDAYGHAVPLVLVGWTLHLEMIFYLLFALAIAARMRLLPTLIPTLGLIAFLPALHPLPILSIAVCNPIILEFLFGIALFQLTERGFKLPPLLSVMLFIGGFAVFWHTQTLVSLQLRPWLWGLPALAIVAAAVNLESFAGRFTPAWLLEIGDASYSLYLSHTFILPLAAVLLLQLHVRGPHSLAPAMVIGLLFSLLTGELVYRLIELPIIRFFRGRRQVIPPSVA